MNEKAPRHRVQYRSDIQVLRAIAVISVVLYHTGSPLFSGGFVGVDIFFVISGYLISGLLLCELEHLSSIDFPAFYARRMRRLLPAFLIVFLFCIAVIAFDYAPIFQKQYLNSGLYALLYSSNILFALNEQDYLGHDIGVDPFLHTWSLSVEEQFYLVWPVFLLLLFKISILAGNRFVILLGIVFAGTASFLASILLLEEYQPWVFFGSPFRIWEFALGALAFQLYSSTIRWNSSFSNACILVGLLLVLLPVFLYSRETPFPGSYALIPTIGTFLLLSAGKSANSLISRHLLENRILVKLGDLSYSWYLWHWPIQIFLLRQGSAAGFVATSAAPLLSLALAYLTYLTVEQKTRFLPFLYNAHRNTFAIGLLSVAFGVILTKSVLFNLTVEQSDLDKTVQLATSNLPIVYSDKCHLNYTEYEFGECSYGKQQSSQTIFLIGDSHAAHWFPAFEKLSLETGYRLVSLTKSACPTFITRLQRSGTHTRYRACEKWREKVIARTALEQPDIIVISNSAYYPEIQDNTSAWQAGLKNFIARISSATTRLFILQDIPRPNTAIPQRLSDASWRGETGKSACAFRKNHEREDILLNLYLSVQSSFPNLEVIRTDNFFCIRDVCEAVDNNGVIVYRDGHHMTTEKSLSLSPLLKTRILNPLYSRGWLQQHQTVHYN